MPRFFHAQEGAITFAFMTKKERYQAFIRHFAEAMPEATTELNYRTPFELLLAVILSAQCTDKRINKVTPPLFRAFPTAEALGAAGIDKVFPYIRSVSYPRAKARYLVEMAQMLATEFGGVPPADTELLQKMPGVGRKTANVIASVIYGQPAMAVDTHVMRVSKRLGLVGEGAKGPGAVERELVRHLPRKYVGRAHSWLILHGRYTCQARTPKCPTCLLQSFCLFYKKKNKQPAHG